MIPDLSTPEKAQQALISALRSGDYTQTRGKLHRKEPHTFTSGKVVPAGYCCLGVAGDLCVRAGVAETEWRPCGSYDSLTTSYGLINSGYLPYDLRIMFGIEDQSLWSMQNDAMELSFDEIADNMEEHIKKTGHL